MSDDELNEIQLHIASMRSERHNLIDGDRVKINVERIKSHEIYKSMSKRYKAFVKANASKTFTVIHDDYMTERSLVCLKEDDTEPRWLFFEGDLIRQ